MLDFMTVSTRSPKKGVIEIYPKFIIDKSTDLMIRGSDFYAIWNKDLNLWCTDEDSALHLIDREIDIYAEEHKKDFLDEHVKVLHMWDSDSGMIDKWHKYVQKQCRDSFHALDERIIFSNTNTTKKDYASRKLSYPLQEGPAAAYNELMDVLYSPDEKKKIEWAIGSVISGDSKKIQKFLVLYGSAGTGKSTVLNIIQDLFEGYYSVFDAKALGSANNSFALEAFKSNPLVAIQHDGDLSRIEDNTRLNSLVSHELMTVNEKFKSAYSNRFNCFLFMGTNKPVRITDAKSGIIRRLIDVSPTGKKVSPGDYKRLTTAIKFELGEIANHCLEVYKENPGAYDSYIPSNMLGATNDFYNFILNYYEEFKSEDETTLKVAWTRYTTYCDEAKVPEFARYSQRLFKEELKSYFKNFDERRKGGDREWNYYSGFIFDKFRTPLASSDPPEVKKLSLRCTNSILDDILKDCPAQYANESGTPNYKWVNCKTTLKDLDTTKLHYVKVPENHIVIDFDLKDKEGNKSFDLNAEAAAQWPATYAELSKGGQGIHLHYIYTGDPSRLSTIYDDDIEIKVFTGNSSLRRKLTKCNNVPIAFIETGLPLREEKKKMISKDYIQTEKSLKNAIEHALNKDEEFTHLPPYTKPHINFIFKVLDDAYKSGITYDVSVYKEPVFQFAANSSNNSSYCLDMFQQMHFKSDDKEAEEKTDISEEEPKYKSDKYVFFDVEVFPNYFLIVYKMEGKDCVALSDPTPSQVEMLGHYKLIGFNNRRYDNHICGARILGETDEQLFERSKSIVSGSKDAMIREFYNWSYTDIYDFCSKKQGLKKWEIELDLPHKECPLPWDQPVKESDIPMIIDYCKNDVLATEAVFYERKADFTARQILADVAGGIPNDSTNGLTTKIIFGNERNPQLVYTDLSQTFPGYEYVDGKNMYRGVDLGKGGYVYAEPGMYTNVALLDVASLHPHSITAMNCFGEYTKNFKDLMDARIAIKHRDFDSARKMLGGKLAPYLDDESQADDLAQALKIAINSVYGLTSASFSNPFNNFGRDERGMAKNANNIVALRGALFMKTLQDEVVKRGFTVAHIKTDSIKIPNATADILEFCKAFAEKYGYTFEHEATYDRMCLVNDAVYIAKYATIESCYDIYGTKYIDESPKDTLKDNKKHPGAWTATGTQFQVPFIFKKLFSKEPIEFADLCETKSVTSCIYLDMNENLPEGEHNYHFVGKVGSFCPMKPGTGGGLLVREAHDREGNLKYDSVTGSKGYRWMEAEDVKNLGKEDCIDESYYWSMADQAKIDISQYGDFEWFVSDDSVPDNDIPFDPPYVEASNG